MKRKLLYTLPLLLTSLQASAQIYTYDANNRLKKVEYGNGVTVSYTYDVLGNRTSRKVTGSIAETYTISVSAVPSNYGTVSGGGTYGIGTNVELKASPYAGFEFEEWNDGSTVNPRTITVTRDQSFTAHFKMSEIANNYDVNGDGVVNSYDLDAIIDTYLGDAPATAATDIDGDGVLTIADASILIVELNDTHAGNNEHEYVDLGLPSGTLWATCNVGASAPEEYGGYYAWGETEEKDYYDWSTYTLCDGSQATCHHIGDDIAGTKYDVAHVKWGGSWRMPTKAQQDELRENCTREWTQLNGVNGILVTGPNGATIFLPAAGRLAKNYSSGEGSNGRYWSSSLYLDGENEAYNLDFDSGYWGWFDVGRSSGQSVRAVISPEEKPQDCPVAEAIDLGLPSGTKWASWNIGASQPEEYGGYYAWGETEEKDVYDWSTYTHCDGSEETCHDIGDDIAGTQYDVAHEKWGGSWTMPSLDQIKELIDNCTQTWTTQNDVNGILVTGPNNATIFLPAAGCRRNDVLNGENYYGYYWSSSLYSDDEYHAYHFRFLPDEWGWYRYYRYGGRSVRAVCP